MTQDNIITRDEVEGLIAEGNLIVVWHDYVLKLNSWIEKHPGGDKAILHEVGRDASDEMDVYHADETLKRMKAFAIGKKEAGPWHNFVPPIQGGIFRSVKEIANDNNDILRKNSGKVRTKKAGAPQEIQIGTKTAFAPILSNQQSNDYLHHSSQKCLDDFDNELVNKDLEVFPALDYETQSKITEKFRTLHARFQREGYFNCNYWGYVREFSRISTLFFLSYYFFKPGWLFLSATCLGLAWHQLTFIAHDAGHLAITHNYQVDNILGTLIADLLGGLSLGWWKRNHNVHHIVTNDPVHDPDIQHLPFFAVSTRLLDNITSTFYEKVLYYDAIAKVFIKIQHYSYYVVLCFGRFNLYRLSWEYLLLGLGPRKGKGAWLRYLELVFLATFFYWFFYLVIACSLHTASDRWLYVLVSHIVTMPVHVQITLSHFAMSTSDLGVSESFTQRQLRTTMDVDCPAWFDYVHGGLQFQAIHHLFPRMPRHNFRAAQKLVKEFCEDIGIKYTIYGFTEGNGEVIGKLKQVAKQASILAECNKHMVEEIVSKPKTAKS
ncbi:fatty acid/sphingolipid desaturase [Nadsonia fulvescens var. elongata DSM 6958]|uniref:Delta 8-(E)-sphingolipid desaturase n=1 Tax=Nadsonia fulvescens var. elongata DSM 6958 TaxID=857566 RepID=A0A1E3PKG1_9ASCO|nr:fatty acid/sphingolipid desaturase [Nadsonia fulvescens var. elongata DSM 6958]